MVKELSPSGNTEEVQHAFDLMEQWLVNGNHKVRDLVVIGFLEDLQNIASWQSFGKTVFILSSGRSLATRGMRLKECGRGKPA